MCTECDPRDYGDYNLDGHVDAADYTVWRNGASPLESQYDLWKSNFGAYPGCGITATGYSVPEPGALDIVVVAIALLAVFWPRKWRARSWHR